VNPSPPSLIVRKEGEESVSVKCWSREVRQEEEEATLPAGVPG